MRTIGTALALLAIGCASFKMSEKDFPELMTKPHGMLAVEIPDGKAVDGFDEKWSLTLSVNGKAIAQNAELNDKEIYKFPVAPGSHEILINLVRSISRPFKGSYNYSYRIFAPMKIDVADAKTTTLKFKMPEKELRVGTLVIGIVVPLIALIGWPAGGWPEKGSMMTMEVVK